MSKYFIAILVGTVALSSCKMEPSEKIYTKLEGKCMGTTYHITYSMPMTIPSLQPAIDSMLNVFEDELSTYRPQSTISQFNAAPSGICAPKTSHFIMSLYGAKSLHRVTDGYLEPTIGPLVNYWGFGYDKQEQRDDVPKDTISTLMELVGLDKLTFSERGDSFCVNKKYPLQKLDLNATAKGHGVDLVALLLNDRGAIDFLVEIGGEVRTKGVNDKGETWTLGINKPFQDASLSEVILPVMLDQKAMATSGNYRNFYKNDTLTFAHIVNPKTGQSQPTDILSASVVAQDCLTADGLATAFMAMGMEKSKILVEKLEDIEVCLIYQHPGTDSLSFYFSSGFEKMIKK